MKKVIAGGTAALLVIAATGSLLAHHSLARFDTAAVRVRGVVVRFALVNPHSIVYVDEKRTDGQTQRWAVEGPGAFQLARRGIGAELFPIGAVIEACGYTLKDEFDSPPTLSIAPSSSNPRDTTPESLSGRVLAGEDVVMPDGKKRSWGDYGRHKCHGPDDVDIHPGQSQ